MKGFALYLGSLLLPALARALRGQEDKDRHLETDTT